MNTSRLKLWAVALFYGIVGISHIFSISALMHVAGWITSTHPEAQDSFTRKIWLAVVSMVLHFALSGLAFLFLVLTRPWQIFAITASTFLTLNRVASAGRFALFEAPMYAYSSALAFAAGTHLVFVISYSICTYALWRQLGASNQRLEPTRDSPVAK